MEMCLVVYDCFLFLLSLLLEEHKPMKKVNKNRGRWILFIPNDIAMVKRLRTIDKKNTMQVQSMVTVDCDFTSNTLLTICNDPQSIRTFIVNGSFRTT